MGSRVMSRSNPLQSAGDPGKALVDEVRVEVGEVEIDVRVLRLGHLGDDRPGDVVARGELGVGVVFGHEPHAVTVAEVGSFAPDRLGDQVSGRSGDVEDGRVELHELHVAKLGPRPVGDGVAVGRGDRRVGRLAEELAGAPGREHGRPRPDQRRSSPLVPDQGASASAVVGQEVDREAVLPDPQVLAGADLLDHRPHQLPARRVAQGVDDPRVRVAPFSGQGDVAVDLVEDRAPLDQLADPLGGLADDQLDDLGVAEPLAGGEGVGDVVLEVVLGVEDTGDPALGIRAIALADLILGDDQDPEPFRHAERRAEPGDAAADDQDVGEVMRQVLGIERGQVAPGQDEWLDHGSRPGVGMWGSTRPPTAPIGPSAAQSEGMRSRPEGQAARA